jgi:nanoRNase/pAp phosphatase (c-di-AMP/oligoRNAs hydrolase)
MYAILGCGSIGYRVAKALIDRGREVVVIEKDRERVSWLERMDILVIEADMATVDLASTGIINADAILVLGDEMGSNLKAVERVRELNKTVPIFVRASESDSVETMKKAHANKVIPMYDVMATSVVREIEDFEIRKTVDRLVQVVDDAHSSGIAIFVHNNPDPDTLASAWALQHICDWRCIHSQIYFSGDIGLAQSREMIKRLGISLERVDSPEDILRAVDRHDKIALIDTARPGENNPLPVNIVPNIVVDHHSTSTSLRGGEFFDIKSNVGSTSTIMTKFWHQLGLPMDVRLATALFYGIKTDTGNFTTNLSPSDLTAAAYLSSHVYRPLLDIFETPPMASKVVEAFGKAITSREIRLWALVADAGKLTDHSALPQLADFLLQEENILTSVVLGIIDETLHISARNKNKEIHIGQELRKTFKDFGSAGGHATSAGGQIPIENLGGEGVAIDTARKLILENLVPGPHM